MFSSAEWVPSQGRSEEPHSKALASTPRVGDGPAPCLASGGHCCPVRSPLRPAPGRSGQPGLPAPRGRPDSDLPGARVCGAPELGLGRGRPSGRFPSGPVIISLGCLPWASECGFDDGSWEGWGRGSKGAGRLRAAGPGGVGAPLLMAGVWGVIERGGRPGARGPPRAIKCD